MNTFYASLAAVSVYYTSLAARPSAHVCIM